VNMVYPGGGGGGGGGWCSNGSCTCAALRRSGLELLPWGFNGQHAGQPPAGGARV